MTKKDYIAIAAAIVEANNSTYTNRDDEAYILAFQEGKRVALRNVAKEFIRIARADNPRFDDERFLKAAGV